MWERKRERKKKSCGSEVWVLEVRWKKKKWNKIKWEQNGRRWEGGMVVEIEGYGRKENDEVSGGKWVEREEMR